MQVLVDAAEQLAPILPAAAFGLAYAGTDILAGAFGYRLLCRRNLLEEETP